MAANTAQDLASRLDACWEMGRIGRSTEALVDAQRLLVSARRADDDFAVARALTCIAWFCLQLGYAHEGMESAVEAKAIFVARGFDWGHALAGSVYSWVLLELGLGDLSYEEADAALAVAMRTEDAALQAFALGCKGMALLMCRQDDVAFPTLERALALAERGGDDCTIALTLVNLAYSLMSQAELAEANGNGAVGRRLRERALTYNERAIRVARAYGDLWNLRVALCNGAELAGTLGETAMAELCLAEWEGLAGHVGPRERIHFLYTRGQLLTQAGQLEPALLVCREAAALAANGSNVDNKAYTLRRLADAEAAMGLYREALEHFRAFHDVFVAQMGETTRRRAMVAEMQLQNEHLKARADRLELEASQDALTGLGNRRAFEADFAALEQGPFTLAILDLDHFKRVNDRYSHLVGDAVLQRTGALLQARATLFRAYRLGGEEFAILLPGLGAGDSGKLLDGLRRDLAAMDLSDLAAGLAITTSIGAVEWGHFRGRAMLEEADRRLYSAKAAGRNRLVGLPTLPRRAVLG